MERERSVHRIQGEYPLKKKKTKKTLSATEKELHKLQSGQKIMARSIFRLTGFNRIVSLADKEFTYENTTTDFDDVYVYENILVCIEYTVSQPSSIGDHLKKKKLIYDKIDKSPDIFCQYLCSINKELEEYLSKHYNFSEIIVKVVYCSRHTIDASHKTNVPNPVYLDYAELRYFKNITDCIKKSAQHELINFLDIDPKFVGSCGKIKISSASDNYSGSLLPEANSNFDAGFKVVSFYVDPESLLKRCYVLRKDGWRDSHNMYQRMISKGKIDSIRKYLKRHKRVFVNNIIATLPSDTKIVDDQGDTVNPSGITSTQSVEIQIPNRINTIGLIDGQHRTYSYYEAVKDDQDIAKLRTKQNLLVTGIIYPNSVSEANKEKFEAQLFLELNTNQANAKSNLKQAIGLVLEPFSAESIATRVLVELDKSSGPLSGQVERYWFDKNKLKTTSIVSYALKPLVKTSGIDSLYSLWGNTEKTTMVEKEDQNLLEEYVEFCVNEVNQILSAAKNNLPTNVWTVDKSVNGRMLTTTNINALLICLRVLIEKGESSNFATYKKHLSGLNGFNFKDYHSSQYKRMAEAIYLKFFT